MKPSTVGAKTNFIIDFFGLKRNILLLLGAIIIASTGERVWSAFSSKYLETLGASIFLIGLYDGLQTFLGAIYAYPGAWLTEHLGQRRSLLLFTTLSLVGYLIVYHWESQWALVIGVFFFLAWSALSLPASFSIVATNLKKEKHTMGIGVQSFVRRIPMMIGPLIGGLLIARLGWVEGVKISLLVCITLTLATFVFVYFLQDEDNPNHSQKTESNHKSLLEIVKDFPPKLRELLLSDILIRFCERIPYAFVVLWAIDHNGVTAEQFGTLVGIEMLTAMVCYIPVAHLADRHGQGPFVLATFFFFTLFPVSLLFSIGYSTLIFAFIVRGLKEFGEPARKALIISYAPEHSKTKSFGAYYLIRDVVVTSGSFLGAALWKISPQANFIGAAVCGLAGTIWFSRFVINRTHAV